MTPTPNTDFHALCRQVKALLSPAEPRVYVQTFGCQQNVADGEKMLGIACEMGYSPCERPEEADLILVNTCAIREHAEIKALSVVGQYKHLWEQNPDLIIGVTGCMTAQAHRVEQIRRSYPYITFTLAPGALHEMPQMVLYALQNRLGQKVARRHFALEQQTDTVTEGLPVCRGERHRAWVPVMYGCNNFCSYCIVPYVRGRERSRASGEIVREVKELIEGGVREITLLGQNVNSYRGDVDFATLLSRLAELEGDFLLHFMTSHPKDVPDELIRVMADHPDHIAPRFHLPLQSGSDRILAAMNRRYTAQRYLGIVDRLRAAMPHISLTTDIIVGFPGETEEDFAQTLEVLRRVQFDMVYAFVYSPRKGTAAAEMPDQVPDDEKKSRMNRLLSLQGDISLACAKRFEGQTVRVLVDGPAKTGEHMYSGRTAQNRLVHFPSEADLTGQYVRVRVDRADAFALYGTVTE